MSDDALVEHVLQQRLVFDWYDHTLRDGLPSDSLPAPSMKDIIKPPPSSSNKNNATLCEGMSKKERLNNRSLPRQAEVSIAAKDEVRGALWVCGMMGALFC
jgi:hypothetical protein